MGNEKIDKEKLKKKILGKIKVTYNGKFPNACSGRLIICRGGIEIYNKENCCTSTGSVTFDGDWNETIESGELIWDSEDSKDFDRDVKEAVEDELFGVDVCCGGCV